MKRYLLVPLLLPLVTAQAVAQHGSPAIPASELAMHARDVTALYQWPDLESLDHTAGVEEVRLWAGDGSNSPGMAIRIVRVTIDSASGQTAMWWQKDGLIGTHWQSLEGDFGKDCERIVGDIAVEGCRPGPPPNGRTNFADLLTGDVGQRLRDAVFNSENKVLSEADSAFLIVEYRLGDRFARAIALTRDAPDDLALPAWCLYEQATLVGSPAALEVSSECE